MIQYSQPVLAMTMWQHLRRMGVPGLVVLGIADNSIIPLTGRMDVLNIWPATRHREPWPYYAFMATPGTFDAGDETNNAAANIHCRSCVKDMSCGWSCVFGFRNSPQLPAGQRSTFEG
jgi:hypothetical protein